MADASWAATARRVSMVSQGNKKSRRSSTTVVPATPAAAAAVPAPTPGLDAQAPSEVQLSQVLAQHLGEHLSQEELLTARLVCKGWCRNLPAGRKAICIEQPLGAEALTHIPTIFRAVDSVTFTVSERQSPSLLLSAIAALGCSDFYRRLRHLTFITTSPSGSKSSTWPYGMPFWPVEVAGMQGLESLSFIGRAPQAALLAAVATTCTGLTSLVLGTQPEDALSSIISADVAGRMVTRRLCFAALSRITSLRRLSLALADPSDGNGSPTTLQIKALAALQGLTELRVVGATIKPDGARSLLRALHDLSHISLVFTSLDGKLYERGDLSLWRRLQHVELRLQDRVLEGDLQLLTLALPNSLRSLHLRSCVVSPYSLTALSALVALRELSFDGWTPNDEPAVLGAAVAAVDNSMDAVLAAAASGVRSALAGLLAGPLGRRLGVLRMDLAGPSKDIYGDIERLSAAWSQGPLRVLHLVNTSAYELASSGALSYLTGLRGLRELRVVVQGPPSCNGCTLRAVWLPPGLTSLELAGLDLPCAEEELEKGERGTGLAGEEAAMHNETEEQIGDCDSMPIRYRLRPRSRAVEAGRPSAKTAEAGGAVTVDDAANGSTTGDCGVAPTATDGRLGGGAVQAADGGVLQGWGHSSFSGHARLRNLRRLSLNGCRFGCCGHLRAALGPALLPWLSSLELNDVVGLHEEHLADLAALTCLTSLSMCALRQADIGNASLAYVSGLSNLRHLKWHVGDPLDAPPHPAVLKPLRRLAVLDVSSGQWQRMSRWHVTTALAETLPRCELATS